MEIKTINITEVQIDSSYQRATGVRAHKIAQQWDYRLYRPIVVNIRQDGSLYCLDGAHRLLAMKILNKTEAIAEVFQNLTAEEEAYIYSNQSVNSKPLKPIDVFKANLFRGKESDEDVQINQAVKEAGSRVSLHEHQQGWYCISYLRNIYRQNGKQAIVFITNLAKQLHMEREKASYSRHIACLGTFLYRNNITDIEEVVTVFKGMTLDDCKRYAILNKLELSTSTSSTGNSNLLVKVFLHLKEQKHE